MEAAVEEDSAEAGMGAAAEAELLVRSIQPVVRE